MRAYFRPLLTMCLVLLAPVLPFLFFGEQLEAWTESLRDNPPGRWATAGLAIGLLATDILLPVPSSVVSTMAAWQLGAWWGTWTSWIGMTLGAALGFFLARTWGRPFVHWFTGPAQLERMQELNDQYGPFALIFARGVPVLAEASVLLCGMHGLSWKRFLPPVLLSNLGLSIAYSVFGEFSQKHGWLPLALGVSIALPVLLAASLKLWTSRRKQGES